VSTKGNEEGLVSRKGGPLITEQLLHPRLLGIDVEKRDIFLQRTRPKVEVKSRDVALKLAGGPDLKAVVNEERVRRQDANSVLVDECVLQCRDAHLSRVVGTPLDGRVLSALERINERIRKRLHWAVDLTRDGEANRPLPNLSGRRAGDHQTEHGRNQSDEQEGAGREQARHGSGSTEMSEALNPESVEKRSIWCLAFHDGQLRSDYFSPGSDTNRAFSGAASFESSNGRR